MRHGVSKDSGARKTRLGKSSCKSCSRTCVDWDLTSGNAFEAFMFKRQEMLPDERPSLLSTNGS